MEGAGPSLVPSVSGSLGDALGARRFEMRGGRLRRWGRGCRAVREWAGSHRAGVFLQCFLPSVVSLTLSAFVGRLAVCLRGMPPSNYCCLCALVDDENLALWSCVVGGCGGVIRSQGSKYIMKGSVDSGMHGEVSFCSSSLCCSLAAAERGRGALGGGSAGAACMSVARSPWGCH